MVSVDLVIMKIILYVNEIVIERIIELLFMLFVVDFFFLILGGLLKNFKNIRNNI